MFQAEAKKPLQAFSPRVGGQKYAYHIVTPLLKEIIKAFSHVLLRELPWISVLMSTKVFKQVVVKCHL